MRKILLSAYACEPNSGSEYGVGWNMAVNLSKFNKVYVLTRSRCRSKIENEIRNSSFNLEFIFYDLPKTFYYKKELGSKWGEQYNYILWQLLVRKKIKQCNTLYGFDLIHHLTFNQYRSPSPGFFVNIPFVIGPIGGAETIADCFAQDLEKTTLIKERIRKCAYDLTLFKWLCKRNSNSKYILCSSKQNLDKLRNYCGDAQISIMPAIGFDPIEFQDLKLEGKKSKQFELIYAGKLFDWKGINFFLKAIKIAFLDNNINDFRLKLIGLRFENEQLTVNNWIQEYGLENYVVVIPFMDRNSLLNNLTTADLSVYPAFRDSGSMSVLEASVLSCPTLCFDAGGQDIFPDEVLLKIKISKEYKDTLDEFADKLLWSYHNSDELEKIGKTARDFVYTNLTWERKAKQMVEVYNELF